ncbi:hypothetical protein ACIQZD_10560 [Peribacillus sp. NPDC096447]|uniref:hypothetical protein n=1 Tax=Peribacillus sp. NPDC096447 TaxID=3364394 RepID=UPI00381A7075
MKGKSRLPCELAGYLKLGDDVIITDQDHRILDINPHVMKGRQGIQGTVSLGSKLDS